MRSPLVLLMSVVSLTCAPLSANSQCPDSGPGVTVQIHDYVHLKGESLSKAKEIVTSYVRGGATYQVRSRAVVMACWNMFIPYLVPDLPASQKEALAFGVKGPLVYTSVAVKNWTAFQKLGVSSRSDAVERLGELGLIHH